jgi:hypothetical protein
VHLDRQGQPTWEWLYFLHPGRLIVELWSTVWFAAPNLILALLACLMFTGRVPGIDRFNLWEKTLVIVSSLLTGSIASVTTFIEAFADCHPVIFLLPFFLTVVYAGDFALGLLAGPAGEARYAASGVCPSRTPRTDTFTCRRRPEEAPTAARTRRPARLREFLSTESAAMKAYAVLPICCPGIPAHIRLHTVARRPAPRRPRKAADNRD